MRRQVINLKEELKTLKLKQLSGDSTEIDKQRVVDQIRVLEEESNAVLQLGSIQLKLPSTDDNDKGKDNAFKGSTRGEKLPSDDSAAFDKQILRILASILVVVGLSYLLVMLSNDPFA